MSLLYRELQGTGADSDDVLSSTTSQNHPVTSFPDVFFDFASAPELPNSTNSTSFSFSQQPEVCATQATLALELKNKYNLYGQYAANFDSFVEASDQERVLMSAAWTQVILMNSESKHEGFSESLKKAARVYAVYTLLSPNLASYSGKITGAVIDAMRCCGIEDMPDDSQPAKLTKLTTYIGSQVSSGKNLLKTKVIESLTHLRNIADLAEAVIGNQSIPLTKELCVRLAFLRWVAAAIVRKSDHVTNKDGGKWWEEIDMALLDVRKDRAERESNKFLQIYASDIGKYGDPSSGLRTVDIDMFQTLIDSYAMTVEVPTKTKDIWKERINNSINENGKRARVEEPTSGGGETGDMVNRQMRH